jgi:ABC-type polar amino acid transport system ATPase subunit
LDGVSFAVPRGGVTAVIGSSGSGKSTLLRCLNLLEMPDSGRILWNGQPIGLITRDGRDVRQSEREILRLRADIGMVFQSFNLFPHLSAIENVIEAPMLVRGLPRARAIDLARSLLDRVRLSHRRDSYPHQLSGGEQQRVAIARALAMQPKVMLFDEVTSALDPELKGEVLKTMVDLAAEGMTMVVVSHEIGFVREVAKDVLFMLHGRIHEQGPPARVLTRPETPELAAFLSRILI